MAGVVGIEHLTEVGSQRSRLPVPGDMVLMTRVMSQVECVQISKFRFERRVLPVERLFLAQVLMTPEEAQFQYAGRSLIPNFHLANVHLLEENGWACYDDYANQVVPPDEPGLRFEPFQGLASESSEPQPWATGSILSL